MKLMLVYRLETGRQSAVHFFVAQLGEGKSCSQLGPLRDVSGNSLFDLYNASEKLSSLVDLLEIGFSAVLRRRFSVCCG